MLKIKALNEDSSSEEDSPTIRREAQEEIVLELYNNALRALTANDNSKCIEILTQILQENIPQLETNGDLPKSMSNLKYSCYLNLGTIHLKGAHNSDALDSFIKASELDSTDVTLWTKIGRLALKENLFNKAAYAFSKGLECNESHWPCLDSLISVLYAIRDTISCNCYIGKALSLDPDYIKGHVLRKQIYQDNPAAEEYYCQLNPDHTSEPEAIEIEPEEAEKVLNEAETLCQRVSEVEASLITKPWGTIPLPKALEEFSWVSLAKTVIFCHQYMTENNLSHFTAFDMSKSMSNSGEENIMVVEEVGKNDVCEEMENCDKVPEVVERRMSQNSENTMGNEKEDTPSQTDNDEEQTNMEIDNDETDDNQAGDTADANQKKATKKRKRDVLSDLQIWGWHSKRKRPKKSNKDVTVEDALNRIIPETLLKTGAIESEVVSLGGKEEPKDLYDVSVEEAQTLRPQVTDAYFGTERESEDVRKLWTRERSKVHAVALVKDLVFGLARLWQVRWPKELVPLYIQAFKLYRTHYDQPDPNWSERDEQFKRQDASAAQLHAELATFSADPPEFPHSFAVGYLRAACAWADDYDIALMRVCWLESYLHARGDDPRKNELALMSLETLLEQIEGREGGEGEGSFVLALSNCFRCGLVAGRVVNRIIGHLNMITSMEGVETLFSEKKYREAADIVKKTFPYGGCYKVGTMGRPAQLGILMHSLWYTDLSECFIWTEECLNEAVTTLNRSHSNRDPWEKILDKCLIFCQEIINKESVCVTDKLPAEKRTRLVENLVKIICKSLNSHKVSSVTPWIVLHYMVLREETRIYSAKRNALKKRQMLPRDEEVPPSIALLFSAHEFLGPKGCCLAGNGELLHFLLDSVVDKLDSGFAYYRDKMEIHVEQAFFCLYSYPSKKNKISRHLVDHNVTNPLPLTWEDSVLLYQFFAPETLPEFNSYKSQSISGELEQLFERIVGLMPPSFGVQDILPKIRDFIAGKADSLPDPIGFDRFPYKLRAIYYLIGDYYFKEKEFARCVEFFQRDLCVNPMRVDSWASLGLSYAAQLDQTLNFCEKIQSESEFFERAKCAQVCFRKALELDPENLILWIECGSFEYMVHSFCSRLIKFESENFSMEKFELLESEKESYLCSAENSLEHAIKIYEIQDTAEADERWLQYYLLGKIAEKRRKHPSYYLKYYAKASNLLHENKAEYPPKINYNNPQHLSVEALELHYRVHASILKYLELHEGKPISHSLGALFRKTLGATAKRYTQTTPVTTYQDQFVSTLKSDDENDAEVVKEVVERLLRHAEATEAKAEDPDCSIVEPEVVDIVISDSEEESPPPPPPPPQKDVQTLLDKMMEETMNEAKTVVAQRESSDSSSSDSSASETDSSGSDNDESDSSSDSSSSSSSSSAETSENLSSSETLLLVEECVRGLEVCVTRLAQNYKALYRLAHAFFHYKGMKDYSRCKLLLLHEYKCKDDTQVSGLFSDRTARNFFNGIWRIPSTEIDRPGSLAAHMNRCVSLVLQVLRHTNDTKTLIDVHLQLRKTPNRDKIYIKDSDRVGFANQAMDMCVQSFRGQIKGVPDMPNAQVTKLLNDLYRVYRRVQKHIPNKEGVFGALLTDAYKNFIKEKIPENVNVLDLAIKFCVQYRPVEKPKPPAPTLTQRNPGQAAAPVLPTPGTFAPSPVLKPPTVGRPRGRPPLPKVPGQQKPPRPKYGSAPWQDYSNLNYEYLKQYQEQLIKQYSQNMSINELQQLTSLFSSGQLNNPAVSQAFVNQFFTQTSGFLNQSLFKPPGGGLSAEQLKILERVSAQNKPKEDKSVIKDRPNLSITPVTTLPSSLGTPKFPTSVQAKTSINYSSSKPMTYKPKPTYTSTITSSDVTSSTYKNIIDVTKSVSYKPKLGNDAPNTSSFIAKPASYTPKPARPYSLGGDIAKSAFKLAHSTSLDAAKSTAPKPAHSTSLSIDIPKSTTSPKSAPKPAHSASLSIDIAKSAGTKTAPKPAHSQSHDVAKSSSYKPKSAHTSASKPKAAYVPTITTAHSATMHPVLPSVVVTPPPPQSVSPAKGGSPGKTLQEKLADKKKEQMMKSIIIEADIYNKPKFAGQPVKFGSSPVEQLKLPAGLSLSAATVPPPVFAHAPLPPRFGGGADSGVSISQISDKKQQRTPPVDGAPKKSGLAGKKAVYSKNEGAQALSVIKKLSAVDITPLAPSRSANKGGGDDDVICID
ncbi:calcineurin-binding protein cabin-1-like isoform X8 [Anthonomus grandis grandis]|uniref:calcineurin-binding protein cabin-1-like isoform X5 n=1 Tax=Anthonomus grandis grandis TaxID=2921223 RepID=UPI0021650E85|nr:calcineurin-binding protein cabin-1-like isoform X5 [Anthonomus grandis grandis]XP_050312416.1 calcineurin-binding protein cabin-1-like isoform X6 [Anthonomus grandis grandis]XP_050312417.1 calcineurin-binding protein cabin-1-like isoform X7 [Anthonomus grandis grandis]XP_050312418.1 calcineurin-binding protein cabin-1-like isoform X8 [Anthonomus grandis grandis]